MSTDIQIPSTLQDNTATLTDEVIHITLDGVCGCGSCAAKSVIAGDGDGDTETATGEGSGASGSTPPTEAEIIAALQFELSSLTNDTLNTTADEAWEFTYQFEDSDPADLPTDTTYTGWEGWTAAEKTALRDAFDHIETFANVTFTEVTGESDPDINLGLVSLPGSDAGFGGFRYSATSSDGGVTWTLSAFDGFAVFDKTIDLTTSPSLVLHEIGHALTLKHPFSGSPTIDPDYDNNKWSVMSYTANPDTGVDGDVMQLHDVLAIQDRWGANDNYNDGSNKYTGPRTATTDLIWDTGGNSDWLDAGAKTTSVILNLNEGTYSRFGTYDDVIIAYGVEIEHARGGREDDTITGNFKANKLYGGKGNDEIEGGLGKDQLFGNDGADILRGGDKDDILKGGKGQDELFGGNQKDTLLGGNGKDDLDGGNGDDTLTGGNGRDTFFFREGYDTDVITDFEDDKDRVLFEIDGVTTKFLARGFAHQDGDDVVFDFGGGDDLRILNITLAAIDNDFNIV